MFEKTLVGQKTTTEEQSYSPVKEVLIGIAIIVAVMVAVLVFAPFLF